VKANVMQMQQLLLHQLQLKLKLTKN